MISNGALRKGIIVPHIRNRFRTKLFILVSALVILSMSFVSAFLLMDIKNIMSQEFREKGILLAMEFSQKTAEGIVIEDKKILDRFISQLFQIKDVHYVYIYNDSGLILSERLMHEGINDYLTPIRKYNLCIKDTTQPERAFYSGYTNTSPI